MNILQKKPIGFRTESETENCLTCGLAKAHPSGHKYCKYWSFLFREHCCTDHPKLSKEILNKIKKESRKCDHIYCNETKLVFLHKCEHLVFPLEFYGCPIHNDYCESCG